MTTEASSSDQPLSPAQAQTRIAPRSIAATALICGAFFASGAAALTFETLWFHQAALVFGSSIWASSLVLSGFMAGMALGSVLAARFGERVRAPIAMFVVLEVIVAVSGVALVYGLPALTPLMAALSVGLGSMPLLLNLLRFGAAFGLLVVPSIAMGMTLPLLARGVRAWDPNFGRVLGLLYGLNTLGAVGGVLATELSWVEAFGIRQTALVALGCNVLAAALGFIALRGDASTPPPSAGTYPWRGARWLIAGFFSGFAMLALEVVWLRCLSLFLNDTPLAFAVVLAGVLLGIAVGSIAAALWASRTENAGAHAGYAAIAAGVAGVLTYRGYAALLQEYFEPDQTAATIVGLAWPIVVPTALASGALFTLLGTALQRALHGDAVAVGRLAFVNMLGGAAGSLLAGFVLLPSFGMEVSLFAMLALFAVVGLLLVFSEDAVAPARIGAAAVVVFGLAMFPWGEMRSKYLTASASRFMRGEDQIVSVREGVNGTLVHVAHRLHGLTLFEHLATNAYAMTANDFAARRYMKLFVLLPQALHPKLERALIVGYGIGNTAAALTADKQLEQLDIADISREILGVSQRLRTRPTTDPLADPRVRVYLEDGRQLLAGPGPKYDLITGEPPPPVIAGVVNLYTREYFELVRSRLAPGGMATHWLPMMNITAPAAKSIIRAFCEAFEDCSLWHASARNFMLLGTHGAKTPASDAQFRRPWADADNRQELVRIGLEIPEQLGPLFIGDAAYLKELTADTAALTDDRPRLIHAPGSREDRDALMWQWRDTRKARERFVASSFIATLFPPEIKARGARNYENQRLVNDLLFPEKTPVRQTQVLHQVLTGTRLQMPVLMLLNSDPDVQRELAKAPEAVRAKPEWRVHRLAGLLADRNYSSALELMKDMPKEQLPYPDLIEYVQFVVQRTGGASPH